MKKYSFWEWLGELDMRWIICLFICLMCIGGWTAWHIEAQDKPPAAADTYEPTEVEALRVQVKYLQFSIAQIAVQQANANFQRAAADFNAEVNAIKTAHGWPADVQLDRSALEQNQIKFLKVPDLVKSMRAKPEAKKP